MPEQNPIISKDILTEAIRLRREVPSRSVPTIIQILELEGKVEAGVLKRTTLQRALAKEGYSSQMIKMYQDNGYASQRFARVHRCDLWQGDIKYGPTLKVGGKVQPTYLSCLIDDATRYIIHAQFYGDMEHDEKWHPEVWRSAPYLLRQWLSVPHPLDEASLRSARYPSAVCQAA